MPLRDAPVPTDGLWQIPGNILDLTFSHPIGPPGPLDPGNWFIRFGARSQTIVAAFAVANIVRITTSGIVADPGDNVVTYTPPPCDVRSDTAKPVTADAFADFPIHI